MSRQYSTSESLIRYGRRDSTVSNPSISELERLRRRSESSVKYVPGAITTVLYDTTFGALVEQANREREEYIARLDAIKDEPSLAAIAEEDGSNILPDEVVEKYRKHFLKATRHLQQELPNSYVLLTGIGYVPSVISMVQYLEPDSYYFQRGQGRTYLYLVLSAISFYIVTYALLYYILFPWFAATMNGSNMAPLKGVIDPDHDPPTIWATLDYNFIRRVVVEAPPGLHYMPSILGFYRLMYIVYDIASGIFSFIMLTAIILSEKNENYYNGGGIEQFVFTVWIFIINTLMFIVHIYALFKADTELRRQWHRRNKEKMESSQNTSEMETGQLLESGRQCQTPPPVVTQH
ncbi:hypothetical protein BJV82DRAFT_616039 [Fennellomyces sp. T-0311]|nr:hypothetical protein BJV82DRAFT_616039 [Fennellomyces sp. T-0311]